MLRIDLFYVRSTKTLTFRVDGHARRREGAETQPGDEEQGKKLCASVSLLGAGLVDWIEKAPVPGAESAFFSGVSYAHRPDTHEDVYTVYRSALSVLEEHWGPFLSVRAKIWETTNEF